MAVHANSLANLTHHGRRKGGHNAWTRERVIEELRRIAFYDPLMLFAPYQHRKVGRKSYRFTLREINEMSPEMRACIAGIKTRTENLQSGDGVQDTTVEIKLVSKIDALTIAAKHFKIIDNNINVNIQLDEELLARLDRGRQRNAQLEASRAPQAGQATQPVRRLTESPIIRHEETAERKKDSM